MLSLRKFATAKVPIRLITTVTNQRLHKKQLSHRNCATITSVAISSNTIASMIMGGAIGFLAESDDIDDAIKITGPIGGIVGAVYGLFCNPLPYATITWVLFPFATTIVGGGVIGLAGATIYSTTINHPAIMLFFVCCFYLMYVLEQNKESSNGVKNENKCNEVETE